MTRIIATIWLGLLLFLFLVAPVIYGLVTGFTAIAFIPIVLIVLIIAGLITGWAITEVF